MEFTNNRPLVWVAVFVINQWKFLLWKRKSEFWEWKWCVPWWHLEFWKTLEDCWARETLEESWVIVRNVEFLWIANDITKNKHYVTVFMKWKYDSWEPIVTKFDEFYEWKWVSLDSLPENLFDIFRNFLGKNKNTIESALK